MNQIQTQPDGISGLSPDAFSSVFQAIGGLRNVRATVAMLSCLFAGALLAGLLVALLAAIFGRLGAFSRLCLGIVFFVGNRYPNATRPQLIGCQDPPQPICQLHQKLAGTRSLGDHRFRNFCRGGRHHG